LLGETELDYMRCMPGHRMGDLTPSALGERLLASEVHLDSLALELRGLDGRVIPTQWIDVRDAAFAAILARDPIDDADYPDDEDPEIQAAIDHDVALIREWMDAREPDGFWKDYDDDGDRPWLESSFPRYQIQIRLVDDGAIP
jgi:hypothetical protein